MASAEILVVLPTLGRRNEYLAEALQSFHESLLGVSARLVVVVPADAYEAREIAQQHGASLVDDPGFGMAAAINAGLTARDGERFYIWFGDDDLHRVGGLRFLRDLLDMNPAAPVAFGGCDYLSQSGDILFSNRFGRLAYLIQPFGPNLIPHMSALMRIDSVVEAGFYDSSLKYAMDLDLFFRLRRNGPFASSTRVVSGFRTHRESLTSGNRMESLEEARLIRQRYLSGVRLLIAHAVHSVFVLVFRLSGRGARATRDDIGFDVTPEDSRVLKPGKDEED